MKTNIYYTNFHRNILTQDNKATKIRLSIEKEYFSAFISDRKLEMVPMALNASYLSPKIKYRKNILREIFVAIEANKNAETQLELKTVLNLDQR